MSDLSDVNARYARAIRDVETRITEGFSFVELEQHIEQIPDLDEEERSALWFLSLAADDTPETQYLRRVVVIGS